MPLRELQHTLRPLRLGLVVDSVVGTERLGTRQLVIGAAGDDHPGTGGDRELQRECRDSAGPLHQHDIASTQLVPTGNRIPGSNTRRRQG